MRLLRVILLLFLPVMSMGQHPITFFTANEAAAVKKDLNRYPLLTSSYAAIKKETDFWLGKDVDVPVPKDPQGGYTHDKHKANYMLLFHCGILYNLSGDARYASLAKSIFLKYAALNPTLKKHPQATSSSPGHIFWQALNDANWLLYAGMAYDLIYNSISPAERKIIEEGAFKPEVDYLTRDLQSWFDLIHNHGVWACAGVGITGLATNNKEWVDMALYGTNKSGASGFIAQLNGLFSPDGYYTEGPYYTRYAILPYYLFANALQHARPQLKIFEHRERILLKALMSGLEQTNLNGAFFPLNDALKEKDFTSNELVTAMAIAWQQYGKRESFLPIVKKQGRVILNKGGAEMAAAMATAKHIPDYFPYRSAEYADGVRGDEGGVSLLRAGKDENLTTLVYKYTAHGLSHGHFDKLNYNLFDKGREILTDYGAVRFIGVEQKFGGRYLPESDAYASQTIAHNTLVVDETSHYGGQEKQAEKFHAEKLYSNIGNGRVQAVAAKDENAYAGVGLFRTVYLVELPEGRKVLIDFFKTRSSSIHQYDLPFHYDGQLIKTSFKYQANTKQQEALGTKNGYQFLWKEAQANVRDTLMQFTFLNHRTFYTISSMIDGEAELFLTRTGANDPQFNLRHEPALIIRKRANSPAFISVVEIHGTFDPVSEFTTHAYPLVKNIKLLQNDANYLVGEIQVGDKKLIVAQSNQDFNEQTKHTVQSLEWTGPFAVFYDNKMLK